jgi:peptide/nickel transport system permease protein
MGRWLLRRLAAAVLIVWLVATATFFLVALAPGDTTQRLADTRVSPHIREQWRRTFGLDRPVVTRYAQWIAGAVRGDLSTSWTTYRPVATMIGEALPNTMFLAGAGLLLELLGGVAIALRQARRPFGAGDRALTLATLAAFAMPTFWVALLLAEVFSFRLQLFPASHMHSPAGELARGWARLLDLAHHAVLPVLAMGLTGVGAIARYVRGSLLDERGQAYVLAARARGCSVRRALRVHALPNALLPLITVLGLSLPILVSGSLVIEVVFSWPGMGQLVYSAALARDVPTLMGGTLVITIAVVLGNLMADVAYALLDPRVRLGGGA